jgi:tetratricopeptide (TPR) repeat protein
MLSISSPAVAKVLAGVALAAVLVTGCMFSGQKRRDKALLTYTEVSLTDLNRSPRDYLGRKVSFEAYFVAQTDLYPTFPTPFSRNDYANFSVWPRGARLWRADGMEKSFPQMYVARDSGGLIDRNAEAPLKKLDSLRKYDVITIYGTVVQDNSASAWIVVDAFRNVEALKYSDAVIRRLKLADENYAAKEYVIAVKDYQKAMALGIPVEVEGVVHKNLGLSHLVLEDWSDAEKLLVLAVAKGAGDAECLIGLAEAQIELGKFVAAEANARASLKKDPRSALARADLAVALARQKKFVAALQECEEGLKLASASADVLRARGLIEDLYGKPDRAIESYKLAVLSRPADPRIHRELGQLYVKKGDIKSARLEFGNVVDSVGATHKLRYCRGCCLLAGVLEALGKPKEAVKYYRLSQQRNELYIPAYMGLGSLYAAGGLYKDSLGQFKMVGKRLDPKGDDGFKAWRSMAAVNHARAAKKPACVAEAAKCYERALKIKPAHYDTWQDLALARWQQEKPDRKAALDALAKCFVLKPEVSRPHYLAGCILMEMNDLTNATRELETAARLDPKHPQTAFKLGLAYRELNNDAQAVTQFRAAHALDVKDEKLKLNIKNSLAYVLADLARATELAEAEKLAREVVAAKGGVAAYVDTLGWVQARAGKLKLAKKTLEGAASKASDGNAEVYYHLGYVCVQLKKHDQAITALDKAALRLSQSGVKTARATHLQALVKTLLAGAKAEKARIRAQRLKRLGAVGNPDTQTASPREGQKPGSRPKRKRKPKNGIHSSK